MLETVRRDYETKLQALARANEELANTNARLMRDNDALRAELAAANTCVALLMSASHVSADTLLRLFASLKQTIVRSITGDAASELPEAAGSSRPRRRCSLPHCWPQAGHTPGMPYATGYASYSEPLSAASRASPFMDMGEPGSPARPLRGHSNGSRSSAASERAC